MQERGRVQGRHSEEKNDIRIAGSFQANGIGLMKSASHSLTSFCLVCYPASERLCMLFRSLTISLFCCFFSISCYTSVVFSLLTISEET